MVTPVLLPALLVRAWPLLDCPQAWGMSKVQTPKEKRERGGSALKNLTEILESDNQERRH